MSGEEKTLVRCHGNAESSLGTSVYYVNMRMQYKLRVLRHTLFVLAILGGSYEYTQFVFRAKLRKKCIPHKIPSFTTNYSKNWSSDQLSSATSCHERPLYNPLVGFSMQTDSSLPTYCQTRPATPNIVQNVNFSLT